MSIIWSDMFELQLTAEGIDAHMETAQAAPVSEPTLTLTIEARLDGVSSTLTLLLPWLAIEPVIERFSGRDERAEVGQRDALSVRRAIGGVEVPVRAEVACVHLPIEAVLALKPGDVLALQAPAEGGVTLYADKVPVHRARPGAQRRPARRPGHRPCGPRRCAMSAEAALLQLAGSTSEAVTGVLETFAPGRIEAGDVAVLDADGGPLQGLPFPAVATNVAYVDGVTGGNLFVMTLEGARRLAAAMMGAEDPAAAGGVSELTELELSAVSEAMNQMMASAAGAISAVLGTEVEIGTPETRTFESAAEADGAYAATPHMVRAAFSVCGEPCRLVQLVPNAFVVRMTRALDEIGAPRRRRRPAPARARQARRAAAAGIGLGPSLAGIPVRVWAELGRASMASADVVGLPSGAVVELDRGADEPIDLYVNGRRFATGRLLVVDGSDWAVRIETVLEHSSEDRPETELETF